MKIIVSFKKISVFSLLIFFLGACSSSQARKQEGPSLEETKEIVQELRENKERIANHQFLRPIKTSKYYFWIDYFSGKNKERFQRYINNGWRHKKLIESIFDSYGLPKDLFYVGMIESGYYMRARSHASAVGPWQFIKDTAKRYDLMINRHVDERIHLIKSTHAAARYFKDLYNIFGSWELALTAYNAGEYGLMRRIRKHNTKNYYKLSRKKIIPRETRNYIPKVLAAIDIMNRPEEFGFKIPRNDKSSYEYMRTYTTNKAIPLKSIARKFGLTTSELRHLNPDLKTYRTPKLRYSKLSIYVPKYKKHHLISRMIRNKVNENKLFTRYTIKRGDTLYEIANSYNISITELRRLNKISKNDYIKSGQILVIPNTPKTHVVKTGENLTLIARKYALSLPQLKRINALDTGVIYPGQKLIIAQN